MNIQSGSTAVPGLLPMLVTALPLLVTGLIPGPEATVRGRAEVIAEPEVTGLDPGCGSLELPEKSSSLPWRPGPASEDTALSPLVPVTGLTVSPSRLMDNHDYSGQNVTTVRNKGFS